MKHHDDQYRTGIALLAVDRNSFNSESIGPGIEVGIGGQPFVGRFIPILVETLQKVGVLNPHDIGIIEGGKLQLNGILFIFQGNLFGFRDALFKYSIFVQTDVHTLVEHLQVGEDNRRKIVARLDLIRIKNIETRNTTENKLSGGEFVGRPVGKLIVLKSVFRGKIVKPLLFRIEFGKTIGSTDP